MTANKLEGKARDMHSCSYYCDRPDCVKTQRDELREAYVARQSEGMVPHVWVLERVRDGAIRAVQREAPDDFDMTVAEDENNRYVRYVAAAPADAGEGES